MGTAMTPADELTDGIVTLRSMTPADAELHLAGEDEPTVQYLSGGHSTMETVLAWIGRSRVSLASSGPVRAFGICLTATGTLVGMVEANMAAPGFRPGVANISFGLHPSARGHGHATRAVDLLRRYLADLAASVAEAAELQAQLTVLRPELQQARATLEAGVATGSDAERELVEGLFRIQARLQAMSAQSRSLPPVFGGGPSSSSPRSPRAAWRAWPGSRARRSSRP